MIRLRLRKHDRKMLKISAALASIVLILLGVMWTDLQRGYRGHDANRLIAANLQPGGAIALFHPNGSGISGDFSDHASAFESSGSESSSSIPEPSTLAIAAIGGVILLNRRRAVRFMTK
jgi:hypothetical protein